MESRSQSGQNSSEKDLHLWSGGRSAGGWLLLQGKRRRSAPAGRGWKLETASGLDSRIPLTETGKSHSGEENSFSPSELLLWPSSGTEELVDSLGEKEGRPSSCFLSTEKHTQVKRQRRAAAGSGFR